MQNAQKHKAVRQSMSYVYRSLWHQFHSLTNIAGYVTANQEIENLLDKHYPSKIDAVSDYYSLYTNFQNISLMSLLNDIDPDNRAQISYRISAVVGENSGLYEIASSHIANEIGIYRNDDVRGKPWFAALAANGNAIVWWTEAAGSDGYIYTAKRKTSTKDGRELAIVIAAYDVNNIKGILHANGLEGGYFLLLDERDRVVYSDKYPYGTDLAGAPFLSGPEGNAEELYNATVRGEKSIVGMNLFDNGWKLVSVVPKSRLQDYTAQVAAAALLVVVLGIAVTSLFIRRIVAGVTVPIATLAASMKRIELGEFQPPAAPRQPAVEEVNLLYRGYAYMIRRMNELIEEVYVKDIAQKQLQLELLQAQINPHFLYNTLDMINCKALTIGDADIALVSRSLANVLRYGLNKGEAFLPLQDELKQVASYLDIQMLMHNGLAYRIDAEESLAHAQTVHFILQPLVENSLVHGFRTMRTDKRIDIAAALKDGMLVIDVKDNGCGVDPEEMNRMLAESVAGAGGQNEAGEAEELVTAGRLLADEAAAGRRRYPAAGEPARYGGFGTRNVHERIRLHCGAAYGLRYMPAEVGTWVRVTLPAISGEGATTV